MIDVEFISEVSKSVAERMKSNLINFTTWSKTGYDSAFYYNRASCKFEEKLYSAAIKDLDKAIELNPDYISAYHLRGICKDKLEQYKEALLDFDIYEKKHPNPSNSNVYFVRAYVKRHLKMYRESIDDMEKDMQEVKYTRNYLAYVHMFEITPDFAKAFSDRGRSKIEIGDYAGAEVDSDIALELHKLKILDFANKDSKYPTKDLGCVIRSFERKYNEYTEQMLYEYAEAFNNRGIARMRLGSYHLAASDFYDASQLDCGVYSGEPSFYAGYTQILQGNYSSAIFYLSEAVAINPTRAEAYFERGFAKMNIKKQDANKSRTELFKYDDSITDLDKAIQLKSDYYQAYFQRGISKYENGDKKEAFEDFARAIEINPSYTEAYVFRGKSYVETGEFTKAISDFIKVIELDPNKQSEYDILIQKAKEQLEIRKEPENTPQAHRIFRELNMDRAIRPDVVGISMT